MSTQRVLGGKAKSWTLALALTTSLISPLTFPSASAFAQDGDACASVDLATPPSEPVEIRFGLTGGGEEPLALLWADRGSYPNNGLFYDLEPTQYAPTDRMAAFQAGQLDAGTISFPALVAAVRRGIDARAVAIMVQVNQADNEGAFVALAGGGISAPEDFAGKRVGYYGPNTISEYWVKSAMKRAGADPDDVSFLALPPPAQEQALRNSQIDVAWLARQFLARAEQAGGVEAILTPYEATGANQPSLLVFFSPAFVEANPQAYCAWRADYVQALETWQADRESLFATLIEADYLTPSAANAGPDGGRSPGGTISLSELDATVQDMVEVGFLDPEMVIPASDMVLTGFGLIEQ
jgi:ABC-type nitrate/sulfonate/bicarbonate transport system substrate-binding protein